jgi:hypothetical protein
VSTSADTPPRARIARVSRAPLRWPQRSTSTQNQKRINLSDNRAYEANHRVKDAAGSFTRDEIAKSDSHADHARTTVEVEGNNLVDTLPGRGTE